MSTEKQFVGKVTARSTQYGEMISISFGENDRKLLEQTKNDKGWNNLTLKKGIKGNYYLEIYGGNATAGTAPAAAARPAAPAQRSAAPAQPGKTNSAAPLPSASEITEPIDDLPF